MSVTPIQVKQDKGVVTLEINAPSSAVNVFNKSVATRIHEIYDQLNPSKTQLVIFRSTKPFSFLNGAELVLTQSIKTLQDVHTLTHLTQTAYEKVANSPIPSLAAIEGNCFGCGVEFTLCCDYRVASDSYDSRFYMTELKDYYLLPLFGSLHKLPKLVGFRAAAELLIQGQIWNADQAVKGKLIDTALSYSDFDHELAVFVRALLKEGPPKRNLSKPETPSFVENPGKLRKAKKEIQIWIENLPAQDQPLYQRCLSILLAEETSSASNGLVSTLSTEASRNATSFFFVRTMARVTHLRTSAVAPTSPLTLTYCGAKKETPFEKLLKHRKLKGVRLLHRKEGTQGLDSVLVTNGPLDSLNSSDSKPIRVWVQWGYRADLKSLPRPLLYFPGGEEAPICEALVSETPTPLLTSFFLGLYQLGWDTAVTHGDSSVLNPYLEVFRAFADHQGDSAARINEEMRQFGFEFQMTELYQRYFRANPKVKNGRTARLTAVMRVSDLLRQLHLQSLADLKNAKIRNRSAVDVFIRFLFGFPLSQGSFSEMMEKRSSTHESSRLNGPNSSTNSNDHRSSERDRPSLSRKVAE